MPSKDWRKKKVRIYQDNQDIVLIGDMKEILQVIFRIAIEFPFGFSFKHVGKKIEDTKYIIIGVPNDFVPEVLNL